MGVLHSELPIKKVNHTLTFLGMGAFQIFEIRVFLVVFARGLIGLVQAHLLNGFDANQQRAGDLVDANEIDVVCVIIYRVEKVVKRSFERF